MGNSEIHNSPVCVCVRFRSCEKEMLGKHLDIDKNTQLLIILPLHQAPT